MQGQPIGEVFVRSGLITEDQLQTALEKQRQLKSQEHIGELLVSMGLITERDRVRALGIQWGVDFVDLSEREIPREIVSCVSQELARRYKVIPVAAGDGFLQHVLATHAEDIAKVQPHFAAEAPAGDARSAFLVVRGDENVGVVALRNEGAGVGVVELDWVKPSFRDFTPGEFVYRESHTLEEAGFRRLEVEETESTDEVYLRRMGFAPHGTRWVMELAA